MIACRQCGTRASAADVVCSVCGGFLAGSGETDLSSGQLSDTIEIYAVGDQAADPDTTTMWAPGHPSVWPAILTGLTIALYILFVIGVAILVNWMLRKL